MAQCHVILTIFFFFLDGEEATSVKEQDKGEVVFSDAKKQFLMESLPLILTLNLKRFVQHGRRLQKNSRHISFPTLLDMAPFSTDTCKVKIMEAATHDRPRFSLSLSLLSRLVAVTVRVSCSIPCMG